MRFDALPSTKAIFMAAPVSIVGSPSQRLPLTDTRGCQRPTWGPHRSIGS